jgi:uncharacterized protein (UPF0332 family)
MNPYEKRAVQNLQSAEFLLRAEDTTAAANRAFYAVFQAARAALAHIAAVDPKEIKTHLGLRRLFELHVVKTGLVTREIAQHFNDTESTRLIADYGEEIIEFAEAEAAVRDARAFVEACQRLIHGPKP